MWDDMIDDEPKMDLRFELNSVDGRLTKSFSVDDTESWTKLVLHFADFLSAQYCYGISEQVLFITDFAIGREKYHAITKAEFKQILRQRERNAALDSLFEDEEEE